MLHLLRRRLLLLLLVVVVVVVGLLRGLLLSLLHRLLLLARRCLLRLRPWGGVNFARVCGLCSRPVSHAERPDAGGCRLDSPGS